MPQFPYFLETLCILRNTPVHPYRFPYFDGQIRTGRPVWATVMSISPYICLRIIERKTSRLQWVWLLFDTDRPTTISLSGVWSARHSLTVPLTEPSSLLPLLTDTSIKIIGIFYIIAITIQNLLIPMCSCEMSVFVHADRQLISSIKLKCSSNQTVHVVWEQTSWEWVLKSKLSNWLNIGRKHSSSVLCYNLHS